MRRFASVRFCACTHSIGTGGDVLVAAEVLADDRVLVVGVVVQASVVLVSDDRVEGEVVVVGAEDSLACRQEMSRLLRLLKSFFLTARCSPLAVERTSRRYLNDLG